MNMHISISMQLSFTRTLAPIHCPETVVFLSALLVVLFANHFLPKFCGCGFII